MFQNLRNVSVTGLIQILRDRDGRQNDAKEELRERGYSRDEIRQMEESGVNPDED